MKRQERENPALALLHRQLGKTTDAPRVVGLTGGIASGKSLVASHLADHGIPIIDADEIAHQAVRPKRPAYRQVIAIFGQGILKEDLTIDRQKLGEIVFAHPEKRRLLEEAIHPEVMREIGKKIKSHQRKKTPLIVVDVPLLYECRLDEAMDKNILVIINPKVQLQRLMKRDHLSETEAWQRILSQMPASEKAQKAHFVVDNSGDRHATEQQVKELLKKLTD